MSEPCEAGELTVGEFFRQPIEPERIFREGEMGDFELWQNLRPSHVLRTCFRLSHYVPSPLHSSRVTEAVRRSLLSLAAGVSIKARGEGSRSARAPSGRARGLTEGQDSSHEQDTKWLAMRRLVPKPKPVFCIIL